MAKRASTAERRKFAADFLSCFVCNWPANDIHEIARGPTRGKAFYRREAWLRLCRICHQEMNDYSKWPIERQLALKFLADPEYFDPAVINELRGRAPTAITISDVACYLCLKK